jgi:hypothetical protein
VYLWIWLVFWWYVEIGLNHCAWVYNMFLCRVSNPTVASQKRTSQTMQRSWLARYMMGL